MDENKKGSFKAKLSPEIDPNEIVYIPNVETTGKKVVFTTKCDPNDEIVVEELCPVCGKPLPDCRMRPSFTDHGVTCCSLDCYSEMSRRFRELRHSAEYQAILKARREAIVKCQDLYSEILSLEESVGGDAVYSAMHERTVGLYSTQADRG